MAPEDGRPRRYRIARPPPTFYHHTIRYHPFSVRMVNKGIWEVTGVQECTEGTRQGEVGKWMVGRSDGNTGPKGVLSLMNTRYHTRNTPMVRDGNGGGDGSK